MNYLKLIFLTIAISILNTDSKAQTRKGDLIFNVAIGVLPTYFMDASKTVTLPIQTGIDYKLSDIFSIGIFTGYSACNSLPVENRDGSVYTSSNKSKMNGLKLGFNSTNMNKWELYGGFQLAYSTPDIKYTMLVAGEQIFPRPKVRTGLVYSGYLGATVFVTNRIGIFGAIGYGISLVNLGTKTRLIANKNKRCRTKRKSKGCY